MEFLLEPGPEQRPAVCTPVLEKWWVNLGDLPSVPSFPALQHEEL